MSNQDERVNGTGDDLSGRRGHHDERRQFRLAARPAADAVPRDHGGARVDRARPVIRSRRHHHQEPPGGHVAAGPPRSSVGPVLGPAEAEIIGVDLRLRLGRHRRDFHVIGQASLLGIRHASAWLSNRSLSWPRVSPRPHQPISGSFTSGRVAANSRAQVSVPANRTAWRSSAGGKYARASWPPRRQKTRHSRSGSIETRRRPEAWVGAADSNRRPRVPKTRALPGCATPRRSQRGGFTGVFGPRQ